MLAREYVLVWFRRRKIGLNEVGWESLSARFRKIGRDHRPVDYNLAATRPVPVLIVFLYAGNPVFFARLDVEIIPANTAAFEASEGLAIEIYGRACFGRTRASDPGRAIVAIPGLKFDVDKTVFHHGLKPQISNSIR